MLMRVEWETEEETEEEWETEEWVAEKWEELTAEALREVREATAKEVVKANAEAKVAQAEIEAALALAEKWEAKKADALWEVAKVENATYAAEMVWKKALEALDALKDTQQSLRLHSVKGL